MPHKNHLCPSPCKEQTVTLANNVRSTNAGFWSGLCWRSEGPLRAHIDISCVLYERWRQANMGGRMSHKIFSKKFSIALITIIWSWNSPIYAQSLMTDFENLFERCRISVETNTAFDIEGLQPADVGEPKYVNGA
jgi:hypothetical protein